MAGRVVPLPQFLALLVQCSLATHIEGMAGGYCDALCRFLPYLLPYLQVTGHTLEDLPVAALPPQMALESILGPPFIVFHRGPTFAHQL